MVIGIHIFDHYMYLCNIKLLSYMVLSLSVESIDS